MDIKITVRSAETVPLNSLEPFQGELKSLEPDRYEKLKSVILKMGFSFAVHIWRNGGKNFIIDGHQRIKCVKTMVEKEGYACPPIPVNLVEAKDFTEAKKKVLAGASQYGTVQQQGLYDFMKESGIDFEDLNASFDFPDVDFDDFKIGFFEAPPPKDSTGSTDLSHMGDSKLVHKCPRCGFEFDGKSK